MTRYVEEVMNRELFSTKSNESVADVRGYLVALGVSVAPVLGAGDTVLGVVSLRDLLKADDLDAVGEHMSRPATTVNVGQTVEEAARLMADTGHHRLVAVDANGRAAGIVSSLDIVRASVGVPTRHPAAAS